MSQEKQQVNFTTESCHRRPSSRSLSSPGSFRSQRRMSYDQASVANSLESNEEYPGKLEEDVLFPMEQHLMEEGPSVRVQELDALRSLNPTVTAAIEGPLSKHFTLVVGVTGETVEASSLSNLIKGNRSLSSLLNGDSGIWWLDCHNPTEEEVRALARTFNLHPLTTEDVVTQDPLEKFEMFKNYAFVAFKTVVLNVETGELEPVKYYMAIFRGGVITFHSGHEVPHASRVLNRMRQLRDWVKVSPVWICYALLDDITDSFESILAAIENEAAFVEHAVFVDNGTSEIALLLGRLGQARQKVMSLVRLLYGKTDVMQGFIKVAEGAQNGVVSSDMGLYLGDIRNRLASMKENLMYYESILSRSHNSYMGILQVEYVNSNTRMTTLLGKVTIIGTVLVPINLVFGAWGMNVPVPGQDSTGLGWFFGIVGIICFIVACIFVASWIYFHRVKDTKREQTFI